MSRCIFRVLLSLAFFVSAATGKSGAPDEFRNQFITGNYQDGAFESQTLANDAVGALLFYNSGFFGKRTVIANVEGGFIWDGHEIFDRSGLPPELGVSQAITQYVSDPSAEGGSDFHATMVGHVLAGTGFIETEEGGAFTYAGIGMAPYAELWSGAVATSYSSEDIGAFGITTASVLTPYRAFFRGIEGRKADVINSSWGGGDPAAADVEARTIDALARENPTVAFVASSGNFDETPVSSPGSNYNNITVGSVGSAQFLTPSDFSSRGAVDFYNPVTNTTLQGVRVGVDIAAPGEDMFLAAYLGPTGGLQYETDIVESPSPNDLFFLNQSGTSFAAPIVAGGIALLKDVALSYENTPGEMPDTAYDTRVIKSVIMAGARETEGWDNGQTDQAGVITTSQSLDYATGAGALDLEASATVYLLSPTADVDGLGGGQISASGWDFGALGLAGSNDYIFDIAFDEPIQLTISLNWFSGTKIDEQTDFGESLSFANLNLELWLLSEGVFTSKVAESNSIYNNSEFLRLDLFTSGYYGLRVVFPNGFITRMNRPRSLRNTASPGMRGQWKPCRSREPSCSLFLRGWLGLSGET